MNYRTLKLFLSVFFAVFCINFSGAQEESISYPLMNYDTPKRFIIRDIKMEGIESLNPEVLIVSSGMSVGDTIFIPGDYITGATRKLWSQRMFSDVKVVVEEDGEYADLIFYLKERPRVYKWEFEGLKKSDVTELTTKLNLGHGTELSEYRINFAIETIRKYLREKSYMNSTVEVIQENDPNIVNGVNVTFKVDKGPKVKIGDVTFSGNETFREKTLRKTLKKTKKKNLNILVSSKFKEKLYEEDKENLIDFYNSKGYRNAIILSDSIYDISPKRIGIHIDLDEGNKFYYRNITWLGNSKLTTEQLDAMLSIDKGDTYDNKTMNKRLGIGKDQDPDDYSVVSIYQDDGYLFFQIDPQETVVAADSIDIEIKMVEGRQATINRVIINGNETINDQVIRREIDVLPGELYSRALIISSARRLAMMGHFNPENVVPDFSPVSNELVDVTFDLEEQPSDQLEISGGWGASTFVGSVGVVLNNFSIQNMFKKGEWRPYPKGDGQQLALRAQSNGTYYTATSLTFTEPWLGGKKPYSFTVGFYFSNYTDAYYAWQSSSQYFRTIGGSVGLGRRLSWPDRNFTLYHELLYQSYNLKDWDSFIISNGSSNIIALTTVFSRNTLGQPIYPRSGSELSVSLSLTPPYSLFDGKDYKSSELSEQKRYRWIEYHKWHFLADWYFPLDRMGKFVIRAKAELGFIGSYNKYKPSPFEGYEVGGDGLSGYNLYGVDVIGLRGYGNAALTPNNSYAKAYNKYTIELRYPFVLQPSSTIYGLIFAEGGNAFDEVRNIDPFLLKRSLGVGLRIYLPIVGLIGVDWGYGFDRAQDGTGKRGEIHFIIGQQF
ncbi:MAG: outer membrane protein assembly factor BamA [Rikenellaceae bacterium]|nr:outer membrane protein assembly factor BamA [Rikenellaceae bacterium]